ncbi:lectin BRA-2-like [Platysternon megacephalum]|uniref:Lectin BRA-2-like n=1 Tax=Platysternon megacephalum TaxID=55544 RepID=A0A4D9DK02_9SAUR|nr:lectin BRA-2-like [Platysternon megacephalum]
MCHPWWQPLKPACAWGPATCTGEPHSIGEPLLESSHCEMHSECNPPLHISALPTAFPPSRDDPCLLIVGGTTPEQLESRPPPATPPPKASAPLCSFQLFLLPLPLPAQCSAAHKEEAQPHHVTEQSGGHVTPHAPSHTSPLPPSFNAEVLSCAASEPSHWFLVGPIFS